MSVSDSGGVAGQSTVVVSDSDDVDVGEWRRAVVVSTMSMSDRGRGSVVHTCGPARRRCQRQLLVSTQRAVAQFGTGGEAGRASASMVTRVVLADGVVHEGVEGLVDGGPLLRQVSCGVTCKQSVCPRRNGHGHLSAETDWVLLER